MRIKVKGKKFVTEHIWFENFENRKQIKSKADRVCVHANNTALTCKFSVQHSLITDLSKDETEIFNCFNPTVRNEIRRAEREGVACESFETEKLKNNETIIYSFAKMYKDMYEQKGLDRALPISEINAYIENNCFLLTTAKLNGEVCVFHSYIIGNGMARLLHSCSEFRVSDNAERNAIGRANKLLHFQDMKYLKEKNLICYDWGGISSVEQPNGIDKFKMSFSGQPTSYYNGTIDLSFAAKLFSLYKKIFKKQA